MPSKQRPAKKTRARKSAQAEKKPRQRLLPAVRRTHILDAAAGIVVKQGFLPVSIEQVAKVAGTSKALVYTYFPSQFDIFNALLERELTALLSMGLDTASRVEDLEQAAELSAVLYFEHVVRTGPLLHILVDDRYMRGHADKHLSGLRIAVLHRLARRACTSLELPAREVLAAIQMMTSIPEESGRMVFHGELDHAVARQICRSLVLSALQALRAPRDVLAGADEVA